MEPGQIVVCDSTLHVKKMDVCELNNCEFNNCDMKDWRNKQRQVIPPAI